MQQGMKKIFSNVMLVAAAAVTFFSCQKQETIAPEVSEDVMLTFVSEKPSFDDETKTEWTGETVQWSAGDKISVAYTVEGTWQNANGNADSDAKLYKSDAMEQADVTGEFNVSASFKGTTEGSHVFYGVYPAPSSTDIPAAPVATLTVASSQNPKAASFDSAGDLMVGVSKECASRPASGDKISLLWERLVAHAVITLKDINGIASEEEIKKITLTAQDGANLVGQQKVNLITKEVVCDNGQSNVLNLAGGNLSIVDGDVTFWACVLPETVTALKVEVETDKADYVRDITGISKEFEKNKRNVLAINMSTATRTAKVVDNSVVTDVLTRATTDITGTSYSDWSGKTLLSGAVYAGQSAGGNDAIQLRSNNSNSGVITTASGGNAKKVAVIWNSNTTSGRTLNVYGNTVAYSAPTDLYASSKQGTLIGTIVCGTSTELVIDGDYAYIGMRSSSGAMYLDKIEIDWKPDTAPKIVIAGETSKEISFNGGEVTFDYVLKNLDGETLNCTVSDAEMLTANAADGVLTVTVAENAGEAREGTITLSCGDAESVVLTVSQDEYVDLSVITPITVKEFCELSDGEAIYELTGIITSIYQAYDSQYGNISFRISDGTGEVLIFRLSCEGITDPANTITVGDEITVQGTKTTYNTSPQMNAGGVIVSHKDACAAPVITCADNTVTITAEDGATIYYTTDGGEPSTSSAAKYESAFEITETVTVKAIAVAEGKVQSVVASKACAYVNPDAEQPAVKEYTFTITKAEFNSTSYAANNNEKTSTAKAEDGSTIEVKWTSYQVMNQNSTMQWQKSKGYIYNITDLGTIKSVNIAVTAGTFTQYINNTQQPTSDGVGGYFQIKVGSATGKVDSITVTFEK